MKFTDCFWELANLGERTCEICYEDKDVFDIDYFLEVSSGYDYVVAKVPMNKPLFNIGLCDLGFSMIETQINISKKYEDFNFEDRLARYMLKHVDQTIVKCKKDVEDILDRISPDMFSTDRIYLDPFFDRDFSRKRYSNWIRTEFSNQTAIITKTIYDGKEVGFGMYRDCDGVHIGLLGGVFESEQSEGLGLLTGCVGFLVGKKYNRPFKQLKTSISSNNVPMVEIYNYLNFKVDNMVYVFVKHNNSHNTI